MQGYRAGHEGRARHQRDRCVRPRKLGAVTFAPAGTAGSVGLVRGRTAMIQVEPEIAYVRRSNRAENFPRILQQAAC
jgi:hypothetical protein